MFLSRHDGWELSLVPHRLQVMGLRRTAIMLAVLALSACSSNGVGSTTVPGDEADAISPTTTEAPSTTTSTSQTTEPRPSTISGALAIGNDNGDDFIVDSDESRFQADGTLWLEAEGSDRMLLRADNDQGTHIVSASLRGRNYFPEVSQCSFDPGEPDESVGLVRSQVACTDLEDVLNGNETSIEGWLALPLRLVFVDGRYDGGGVLAVTGDITRNVEIVASTWLRFPEQETQVHRGQPVSSFTLDGAHEEDVVNITVYKDGQLSVTRIEFGNRIFMPAPDDCSIRTEVVAKVTPDTELLDLTINCNNIVDTENTTSIRVSGSTLVDRQTIVSR